MANYIKGTKIQENSISETKLDSSLQSWKETVTNHINNNDNPHNITKSSIGLDNVTNDAQVKRSELGVANGVATLDSTGKVPSGQLPSYVDDVIEGYLYNGVFYKDTSYTTSIVGESGKIYIDLPTNKTYRWTGSVYGVISETIALGETSSTAYRGDRGKIAYDHSQSTHAPSNAQANVIETIKVNGTALTPNSKAVDITIPTVGNGTITIKQGGTSKGTFTTNQNGNTTIELTDTNTTYTAGDGLSLSGTTFSNNGVRSIATGTTNGTISVNTNGNISNIGVYGLKSAAYTDSSAYAAASHTHSYLPLTGGTMANTNVVTNLNADLLDGYHKNDILRKTSNPTSVLSLNDVVVHGIDFTSWDYAHHANVNNQPLGDGALSAASVVSFGTNFPFQIYSDYNDTSYLYYRSYYGSTGWKAWRQFAFLDSNVASATKWANARTITLTGSVTGSVSIDGSQNVSLATTTNHTHTFASLTSKPTTLSGYGITDALTSKFITYKEDFQHYVILLCKIGTNTTNDQHTINGTFWTTRNGSTRYQAAYINVHCADWLTAHNEYYSFTPFGSGTMCRLVTCTYQSSQYLAITFESTQAISIFFDGSYSNILFTPILYYISNTSTVHNSEIYNSITEVGYSKIPLISSEETALTSSNFNSYCPKLDGTGATGTWGINISGNAGSANALNLEAIGDLNSVTDNRAFYSYFQAFNRPSSNYATGILLKHPELGYKYQLVFDTNGGLFTRHYTSSWQPWKTIAFTDSDITGNAATANNADKLDGYHASYGSNKPWETIPVITNGGYMDVGKHFEFHYDNTTGSDYSTILACTGNYSNIVSLPSKSGTLALTTDNVASASKLQNSRTIWGQSFDGTGNVSGALAGVTNISASGVIASGDNTDYQILLEHNNDIFGKNVAGISAWNTTLKPLTIDGSLLVLNSRGGGNVGIGTASPSYKLHVNGDGYFVDNVITEGDFSSRGDAIIDGHAKVNSLKASNICIECDNSGNPAGHTSEINNYSRPLYIQYSTSNNCCICYGGGNVGIGITSPTYKLHVSGDARIDGTISCIKLSQTSDIKYKTNIKQIEYEEALKIIENLNPVTWDWNENTKISGSSSGFVAQEAEEFIPNAISRDNENNLSLDYTQLHSYEIKVIQEQQKEIKDLKQRLEVLENLVLQLTNREI